MKYSLINKILNLRPKNFINQQKFNKWYYFLEDSQWWSKDQLNNYQWTKLKELINHSFANVPYYKNLFKNIDATPNDIRSLEDFKKIPFLTKDIIREHINELFPINYKKKSANYYTTGGSTGEPLGFYKLPENDILERAFMYQQWKRVGFTDKNVRMILRGEPVQNGKLFSKIKFSNDWLFSSYHLSKEHIQKYVDKLNEIKPDYFHVYPSSLFIFTQLLIESGLKLDFSPKAILCGSENLFEYQRELFEMTFNSRAYNWLGLSEQTALAGECEFSHDLHLWPQYSLNEVVDESGDEVNSVGQVGEIIGTNLHNYVTPFIRYKSGDRASWGGNLCEKCKRNFDLLNTIEGRLQYEIILEDFKTIPLTAITFGLHFEAYKKIKVMQIIQQKIGEILIFIYATHSYTLMDENEIRQKMSKAVNNKIKISFIYTNKMKRNNNGKHVFFIQELTIK